MAGPVFNKATGKMEFPKEGKVEVVAAKKFWAELTQEQATKLVAIAKKDGAIIDAETPRGVTAQENKLLTLYVQAVMDQYLASRK